jgi:hypothetical protein
VSIGYVVDILGDALFALRGLGNEPIYARLLACSLEKDGIVRPRAVDIRPCCDLEIRLQEHPELTDDNAGHRRILGMDDLGNASERYLIPGER